MGVGSLSSPNFPDFYPTNISCEWLIEMPNEYTIEVKFIYLSVIILKKKQNSKSYLYRRLICG